MVSPAQHRFRGRLDVDPDKLLERVEAIQNLLNQMPAPVRDKLLADFINRLYATQ